MANAYSLAGVRDNGLAWRYTLNIKAFIPIVSEVQDVPKAAEIIISQTRKILSKRALFGTLDNNLKDFADEIEVLFQHAEESGIDLHEELSDFLTDLYNLADYYRVCIC